MILRKPRLRRAWSQEALAQLSGLEKLDLFGASWERKQVEKRLGRKL
jgi:hypothetical protein